MLAKDYIDFLCEDDAVIPLRNGELASKREVLKTYKVLDFVWHLRNSFGPALIDCLRGIAEEGEAYQPFNPSYIKKLQGYGSKGNALVNRDGTISDIVKKVVLNSVKNKISNNKGEIVSFDLVTPYLTFEEQLESTLRDSSLDAVFIEAAILKSAAMESREPHITRMLFQAAELCLTAILDKDPHHPKAQVNLEEAYTHHAIVSYHYPDLQNKMHKKASMVYDNVLVSGDMDEITGLASALHDRSKNWTPSEKSKECYEKAVNLDCRKAKL